MSRSRRCYTARLGERKRGGNAFAETFISRARKPLEKIIGAFGCHRWDGTLPKSVFSNWNFSGWRYLCIFLGHSCMEQIRRTKRDLVNEVLINRPSLRCSWVKRALILTALFQQYLSKSTCMSNGEFRSHVSNLVLQLVRRKRTVVKPKKPRRSC